MPDQPPAPDMLPLRSAATARLTTRTDPAAPPGELLEALARLLRRLRDGGRDDDAAAEERSRP